MPAVTTAHCPAPVVRPFTPGKAVSDSVLLLAMTEVVEVMASADSDPADKAEDDEADVVCNCAADEVSVETAAESVEDDEERAIALAYSSEESGVPFTSA